MKVNIAKLLLAIFLSIAYLVGSVCLSLFVLKDIKALIYVFFIALILLIILLIINVFYLIKKVNQNQNINIHKLYEEKNKYKEEIKDFSSVYKRVSILIRNSIIYVMIVFVLCFLIIVCSGAFTNKGIMIPSVAIGGLLSIDIIVSFLGIYIPTKKDLTMYNTKHPYIDSIVEECKKELNFNEKIIVLIEYNDEVRVNNNRNILYIFIGIGILNILNEKELKQIIFHEIAHIINDDVRISSILIRKAHIFYTLTHFSTSIGISLLFFSTISNKIEQAIDDITHFMQLEQERKADLIILEKGDKQTFINALAKVHLLGFQDGYRFPFNPFVLEEAPKNFVNYFNKKRIDNYYENKEMYDNFLMKSIQRNFDTHPSFVQRMKNVGVSEFFINYDIDKHSSYLKEVDEINDNFNKDYFKQNEKFWENNREGYYLVYLNTYNKLKEKEEQDLTLDELLKYAYCVYIVEKNYIKAIKLYDRVLEKQPNNAYALSQRGYNKYTINDLSCIDDLKKSKELNSSLSQENTILIGNILIHNGKEDLLKEERQKHLDEMSKLISNEKFMKKHKDKIFVKSDLNEEITKKILNKIFEFDNIVAVYIMKQFVNEIDCYYNICLSFLKKEKIEETQKTSNEIFIFLQSISGYNFYVVDVTYNFYFKKIIKKLKLNNLKKEITIKL